MTGAAPEFARSLLHWFRRDRRDLPCRAAIGSQLKPDPYFVLVSEAMLQQTQVATVIPFFLRFINRFPTLEILAAADEQEVLRLWQGLGYYSRARNLHAAAKSVVATLGGQIPRTRDDLQKLPGVGRYTAGAVASIAFDCRAPILDGNVIRVLCRLDRIKSDPREKSTQQLLWQRAEEILPRKHCGDFNSALMELGATICTPRAPKCLLCPVRKHCEAQAAGEQEQIPAPRKAKPSPLLRRNIFCIRQSDGRYLIEQRPAKGRWAGMWQFTTLDAGVAATPASLRKLLGISIKPPLRNLGRVTHSLTHRRYEFDVFLATASTNGSQVGSSGGSSEGSSDGLNEGSHRRWVLPKEFNYYPLPGPHVKVASMLER